MARNVRMVLGIKGIVAVAALMIIVAALVSYTATVTINVQSQLTQGKKTQDWTISPNDVDQVRYLPGVGVGGNATPSFVDTDSNTWAFKIVTDASKVCAVKIELTAAVNNTKYTKFEIQVMYNTTGTNWQIQQLYDAPTGSNPKTGNFIDGRTTDYGYIYQGLSTQKWYLIKVNYSYNVTDTADAVTFRYTPLPQDSF